MNVNNKQNLKIAIVHYWLVSMRGGEKVVEQLCLLFPNADIYTLVYIPEKISPIINRHNIRTSFIQKIPFGTKYYQSLLPLMPFAVEQFDLCKYDVVISSDTNVTKGIVLPPNVLHINYCHTPMRYAWDMYFHYKNQTGIGIFKKITMIPMMNWLRVWDVAASNRVDFFVANSINVQKRIYKHYRRESEVIYPPVSIDQFYNKPSEDFYLMLGQIIPYKKVDLAVEAFNQNGKKLVIIGEGSELQKLKSRSNKNIQFLGHQSFSVIQDFYSKCKAFIFPGEEDFGITPIEAQASGKPVIAYAKGGVLETVIPNETGIFFKEQTVEALNGAIEKFELGEHLISVNKCQSNANLFSNEVFKLKISSIIKKYLEQKSK